DVSRLLAHTQLDAPTVVLVDFAALSNANTDEMQTLLQQVESLRQQGYRVTMPLDAQDSPDDVTHRLSMADDSQWQLQTV
ncbi:MAG: ATP phosphoribosyltransferase regulatory subunit, partial [Psychrobacter sp.]